MNFNNTIDILNNSLQTSKRGLIRTKDGRLLENTSNPMIVSKIDSSFNFSTTTLFSETISTKNKTDQLYNLFVDVLQTRTNESEIFETVQDLIQTCSDVISDIIDNGKGINDQYKIGKDLWLSHELNTWRLLYCLYNDRLINQKETMDCEDLSLVGSEKQIVEHLYLTNSNLREYQLIVDWLEQSALEQEPVEIGHYTDRTVAWENTLHELQNAGTTMFGSGREIVKSLDPDASFREKLPLHDLDMEDEKRLSKQIFLKIRQGKIEEAQTLCEHCGQPWRAALLEGWRLHHDPNYDLNNTTVKAPIEGNPHRDIWKKCAWMMAKNKQLDDYTRCIVGALCGHLESLLCSLNDSWFDLLWAYLKVQIDIRVESEIRSCSMKSYIQMPDEYWNNKMSLEQIFDEIDANKHLKDKITFNYIYVIQKYLILDDMPELIKQMNLWIAEDKVTPQILRFLTHIVLFMRQIGRYHQEDSGDKVIKSYVECLIKMGDPQLVAFYTGALPVEMQVYLYSQFMETVTETTKRKCCLEEAVNSGLDINGITVFTVEIIRNTQLNDDEPAELQDKISEFDEKKISSLEWLTFYPEQQNDELLWQTNAFIRIYLAQRKINCVRKAFNFVAQDTIQQIITNYGSKNDLPYKVECSIKEYLSHQAYLAAIDGYNDWVHIYHNQPKEPNLAKQGANFTEKIASEHKQLAYTAEVENWKQNLKEQTSVTKDFLYNILLFPDKGWLVDPYTNRELSEEFTELYKHRTIQLEHLRKLYIPEIILLLHNVLHLAGEYKKCLQLADEIVSENRQIYLSIPKHKLADILTKFAETSLMLMNEKLDPWGYPNSTNL